MCEVILIRFVTLPWPLYLEMIVDCLYWVGTGIGMKQGDW